MNKQNSGRINFNFNPEQQKRFNLILDETKRLYPELVVNDIVGVQLMFNPQGLEYALRYRWGK